MTELIAVQCQPCGHRTLAAQKGLTLAELMVSVTIGLLIVGVATALLQSAKVGYVAQEDSVRVEESGRYALEAITRAARQAAYDNWEQANGAANAATLSPYVEGWDARTLKNTSIGIETPLARSVNGSDVLAIRYSGSGSGPAGDGIMLNCAGFGVPAKSFKDESEDQRGWSIFYVAQDTGGEPELYCKFRGSGGWTAQAIVCGVESFQVLYGIDTDGDSLPNQLMTAAAIRALDQGLTLEGATAIEKALERNRKTYWKKVVMVKVALLVRGTGNLQSSASDATYFDLFGDDYSETTARNDPGVRISRDALPASARNRLRKIFSATLLLRNQPTRIEP